MIYFSIYIFQFQHVYFFGPNIFNLQKQSNFPLCMVHFCPIFLQARKKFLFSGIQNDWTLLGQYYVQQYRVEVYMARRKILIILNASNNLFAFFPQNYSTVPIHAAATFSHFFQNDHKKWDFFAQVFILRRNCRSEQEEQTSWWAGLRIGRGRGHGFFDQ